MISILGKPVSESGIKFRGFSWIRHILQSTNPVAGLSSMETAKVEERIDLARRLWIINRYHREHEPPVAG
jgi:hypothetical protein